MGVMTLLFCADTHLGIDLPKHPKIERRRRGHDFFANYQHILTFAKTHSVDALIHGGDLFYRSKIPADLVQRVFEPLLEIADEGIPVYIVPGNHERSKIPFRMLGAHPNIRIFDKPFSHILENENGRIQLAGFPYHRKNVRAEFPRLLDETGWQTNKNEPTLLCVHHCFEGAKVGPSGYTFRYHQDVIKLSDIPGDFVAVLSGHIHRHQILTRDLNGNPITAPVIYPGAIERTAFAEAEETKGFVTLKIDTISRRFKYRFHPLYARPMHRRTLPDQRMSREEFLFWLDGQISEMEADAIVKIGVPKHYSGFLPSAGELRERVPKTMNIDLSFSKRTVHNSQKGDLS